MPSSPGKSAPQRIPRPKLRTETYPIWNGSSCNTFVHFAALPVPSLQCRPWTAQLRSVEEKMTRDEERSFLPKLWYVSRTELVRNDGPEANTMLCYLWNLLYVLSISSVKECVWTTTSRELIRNARTTHVKNQNLDATAQTEGKEQAWFWGNCLSD